MLGVTEVLAIYGQIVAIMNPFTAVNNFIALTEGLERGEVRRVLKKSLVVVLFLGLIFIYIGKALLDFYHISLGALRLGGGILLMYIAIDMLSGQPKSRAVEPGEIAVVPLATPMIVGPGTMTLLIHLGTTGNLASVTVAFILAAGTVAATLSLANPIKRVLGVSGVRAMARFMALIIAGVAAEMIKSAITDWYITLKTGGGSSLWGY